MCSQDAISKTSQALIYRHVLERVIWFRGFKV